MAERDVRERDILVASNEFAYVQDLTKGDIVLYVGPTKISLSNTERLVELKGERFVPVRQDEAHSGVSTFVHATSAQYVILENPAKDVAQRAVKGSNSAVELLQGRRVVVPGPASFPLWPGQRARVIAAHELFEDQYLRVRVYDRLEGAAAAAIGSERIIKGSETSFYVPPTGLEVLPDERGAFVRNAVVLTDGQYCVLRGPKGRRRTVRGPGTVFPEPWEEFVAKAGQRVFAAEPLRRERGLHVRVVRALEVQAGDQLPAGSYQAGQELFLTDREGFFFPTEDVEVLGHVAPVHLGAKEGLSVRELASGRLSTVRGPGVFLPDPTRVELVQRPLDEETQQRWGLQAHDPRRAPCVTVPPSYAVLVTNPQGREVVKGPATRVLAHDEALEVLWLSTGTPKSDAQRLATCFLLVDGNRVSDSLLVKTADHVELSLKLSYRVSFVSAPGADDARWFNVSDYVALLCDHVGSIVRAAVRTSPIDRFHADSTALIRTAVLGEKTDAGRAGRHFAENGMLVYDVEVLEVRILDAEVQKLLEGAQRAAISSEVARRKEALRLVDEEAREAVNRRVLEAQRQSLELERHVEGERRALACVKAEAKSEAARLELVGKARADAEALGVSSEAQTEAARRRAQVAKEELDARVAAFQGQMAALQPELISTLKTLGHQQLSLALTEHLSPLAILGGESVADVAARLLQALPIGASGADVVGAVLPAKKKAG